jgi:hypothetical protein
MTSANILNRVERACAQLHQDGQPVTFTAVAAATGLGRTTLYRNPDLRAVIDQHRHRAATSGTLTGLTDEIATLRTAVEASPIGYASTRNNSDTSPPRKVEVLTGQTPEIKIISRIMLRQLSGRVVLGTRPDRATQPQTLADPHRAGQRAVRVLRDLPQPTPPTQRPGHAHPDRVREALYPRHRVRTQQPDSAKTGAHQGPLMLEACVLESGVSLIGAQRPAPGLSG